MPAANPKGGGGCKTEMRWDGFSVRGDELSSYKIRRRRTGFTAREEWPLQGVFTLRVTDLQQGLASRTHTAVQRI